MISTVVAGGMTIGPARAGAAPAPGATGDGWISVLDHGAVGDGTTDDTVKIQAALDEASATSPGRGVYFPAGRVFRVSDQLTASGLSDAAISGYGATLRLVGAAASVKGAKSVLQLKGCQRVKVLGLIIGDGDRAQQYNGLCVSSSTAVVVDAVFVRDVRFNGIVVFDAAPGTSDDIAITNCTTEGTRFGISSNGKDVRITGNHVAMDWPSTDEARANDGVHPGKTSDYFDGVCVWAGADRTIISGNTITECGQAGVYTEAVTNLVVADNTVIGCMRRGIEVDGQREVGGGTNGRAVGVAITGNVVLNCDGHINLLNTQDATVVGNRIENPVASRLVTCIAVNTGTHNAVVVGNHARQACPSRPALYVSEKSTGVTLGWNAVAADIPYQAPAGTVIMQSGGAGLTTATGGFMATGKIIAAGGLGVGNSVAARRPGSVVRKMQVFAADGAAIGWVPIYDAID